MRYIIFIITLLIVSSTFSQKEKPQNYKRFDEKLLHFGFMLGFNKNAADKAIDTVMRTAEGTISVELIIKAALKSL